jgi:hypothetical protein
VLTRASTLSSLVANINSPAVTGASATPVVFSVRLLIVAQVPAAASAQGVAATLTVAGAAGLTAALQAAGVSVSGVDIVEAPQLAAPPPPPPPPSPPSPPPPTPPPSPPSPPAPPMPPRGKVDDDPRMAIGVALGLFFALLVFGGIVYAMRRVRRTRRESAVKRLDRARLLAKAFGDDEDETTAQTYSGSKEPYLVPLKPENGTSRALASSAARQGALLGTGTSTRFGLLTSAMADPAMVAPGAGIDSATLDYVAPEVNVVDVFQLVPPRPTQKLAAVVEERRASPPRHVSSGGSSFDDADPSTATAAAQLLGRR